jgi:eukaryotic-like serine/threonine-protein kinase
LESHPSAREKLFNMALDHPAGEARESFLRAACGDDEHLLAEIHSLLKAHAEAAGFLRTIPPDVEHRQEEGDPTQFSTGREYPSQMIGRYKLLQMIGEGGFGSVWMAEQKEPVKRRVALKIIKLGMDTRQVVARFEAERQALAMMDHPNIARVLDAGATELGRPFFVMELVKGEPLTAYCDRHNYSILQRLDLFVQVCKAVQHAHQKGIIHRDLKPGNVLVATQDGAPHAKVIDFGIAKAISRQLTEKTLFTEHRQLIGTPEYMSPEQAEGSLDIDTRTDVYSLGVLLYELLTGSTPFDNTSLRAAAYAEIQRIIREVEPPRPSTRLSQSQDTLASIAARRHIEPRRLGTIIRGELDWIVMKCLEKDRARRYETANAIAEDVRRYLIQDPIFAGPRSRSYRMAKMVRRHRRMFASAAAVMLALTLGLTAASYGLVEARAERDAKALALEEAQRSKRQSEIVQGFWLRILEERYPIISGEDDEATESPRELLFVEVWDEAAAHVEELADAAAQAELRHVLGSVYSALGEYEKARQHLQLALAFRQQSPQSRDCVATMVELARVLRALGVEDLGAGLLREARQILVSLEGESVGVVRIDIEQLGLWNSQGKQAEAAAQAKKLLAFLTQVDSAGEEVELRSALLDEIHSELWRQEKYEEAEAILKEAIQLQRRPGSLASMRLAKSLADLAWVLAEQGRTAEAVRYANESLQMRKKALREGHPEIAHSLHTLAFVHYKSGDSEEAVRLIEQAWSMYAAKFGEEHAKTVTIMESHAVYLSARGVKRGDADDHEEASRLIRKVIPLRQKPDDVARAKSRHGEILARLGPDRRDEAMQLLFESYEVLKDDALWVRSAIHAAEVLSGLYAEGNDPDRADQWRANAADLRESLRR